MSEVSTEAIVIPFRETLLTEREVLEGMNVDQLTDFIIETGRKVSELEKVMDLAGEVLEGYGTTVEKQMQFRENQSE